MLKQIKKHPGKIDIADCKMLAEQSINKAKSEFVTLASHQLRTPISAIKWFTEMLLAGDVGALASEQRDCVKRIYISNLRLTAIVDDLLLASNLESQAIPIRPEPVNLPELCQRVLADQLHMQEENKKLKITEHYSTQLKPILLDASLMKIILRTVFSNAVKYTPKGGSITITLKKVPGHPPDKLQLSVADSGYGIPKDEQHNIFVKLYRASNIKDKDTDGTGLGLYIVKGILKQVGGDITFTTKLNQGSTFTITLPLAGMPRHEISTRGANA